MRQLALASALALGLLPMTGLAQSIEREAGPLPRFYPHRDTYLALEADQRSHFHLAYVVASNDGIAPDEIEMWYESGGERVSLGIDDRGEITHLPDPDRLAEAPTVWINQAEGGMSLNMQFEADLPGDGHYSVDDIRLAIGQANHAVREAAGVAALFAPSFRTLAFVFDGPAPQAIAVMADGSTRTLDVQENRVFLRPRDRNMRDLVRVELGAAPVRILLDS